MTRWGAHRPVAWEGAIDVGTGLLPTLEICASVAGRMGLRDIFGVVPSPIISGDPRG